jgi:hypothetical protein
MNDVRLHILDLEPGDFFRMVGGRSWWQVDRLTVTGQLVTVEARLNGEYGGVSVASYHHVDDRVMV